MTPHSIFRQIILFIAICLILFIFNIVTPYVLNAYLCMIVIYCGINIILGTSLNIINGLTGQFSMGHAGFMAVGAYASAACSYYYLSPLLNSLSTSSFITLLVQQFFLVIALIVGGGAAALFGYLVGLPSLKLRGDYLGIVTLGFGEIIRVTILNMDSLGGARGFTGIPAWSNFFWIYFFVVAVVMTSFRLMRSYHGRALLSIREDEIAAASIGISTTRTKVTAFVIGAFIAGVGGGLFAHSFTYLHTNTFSVMKSIEYVVMVVLGGMGNIFGVLLAAALLTILPELLRVANEYRMILYSLMLIILMIVRSKYKGRRKKE